MPNRTTPTLRKSGLLTADIYKDAALSEEWAELHGIELTQRLETGNLWLDI
jgi:hypothetical protein